MVHAIVTEKTLLKTVCRNANTEYFMFNFRLMQEKETLRKMLHKAFENVVRLNAL